MAHRRSIYGISDHLWRQAKAAAASQGQSLSEWIGEAIKKKLQREEDKSMNKVINLTQEHKLAAAFDLGRFARGNAFVRVARRDDGSVYAFPCAAGETNFADETLAYFDFSQMNAADGERAVWDWLNVV